MEIDSDQEVVRYGISLILINVGMYVVIPTIILVKIRKEL
jgi:peptidyl-prolyl cis-trans isomerase B (cyclophilin B)